MSHATAQKWAMQGLLHVTCYRRMPIGGLQIVNESGEADCVMVELAGVEPVAFELPDQRDVLDAHLTAITAAYGLGRADLQRDLAAMMGVTLSDGLQPLKRANA